MHKITINQGRSIPWTFRLVGMCAVFFAIVKINENLPEIYAVPLVILVSLLVPVLWFSYHIFMIDMDEKVIQEGLWIMGYRTGKPQPFNSIESFYINKVRVSQTMYSQTNRSHTLGKVEYKAFLKLDDGEKYFLTSHKNEKMLEEKLIKIKKKLGVK